MIAVSLSLALATKLFPSEKVGVLPPPWIEKNYDFDSREDINDAVKEATLEAKAKISKIYGNNVLSGVSKPEVVLNKKTKTVVVTLTVPDQVSKPVESPKTTSKPKPSTTVKIQKSKSAF